MEADRVAVLILAAGAGRRFRADDPERGSKLLADLDGMPVAQHVLEAVGELGTGLTLVVLGHDADAVEAGLVWRAERRVRNADPDRGLSSSVQVGLEALAEADRTEALEAALILLADQPRLPNGVVERLLAAAETSKGRLAIAPRYADGGAINPVLLRRAGWGLASRLSGDRGFGPLLAAHPELVEWVEVEGLIRDVDTPADLADMAGP